MTRTAPAPSPVDPIDGGRAGRESCAVEGRPVSTTTAHRVPGSPTPIAIRAFVLDDTDAVVALWQACGLTRPWNDPYRDIARKATTQPELFLVGLVDDRLVATAMVGYDGHRGWVNYLAVADDARRRGHARALMEEAERLLAARGCPKLNLQLRTGNAAALGFYRALGYVEDDAICLGKRLIVDGSGSGVKRPVSPAVTIDDDAGLPPSRE